MEDTFCVTLTTEDTLRRIDDAVVGGSITGERIDYYPIQSPVGNCIVAVYEKHYYRAGNRLTLTVVIDDFEGRTRVHCVGGGGGEGLFRFDWGASESFAAIVADTLAPYRVY